MACRARYRYIVEVNSPRDGGWVRWFGTFKSEAEADYCLQMFMPLALAAREFPLGMRVRKIVVFFPRRRFRR